MKFAILEHFVGSPDRPDHWDLMFEQQGVLKTWSVRRRPDGVGSQVATQLFDHRLVYLRHEGPVVGRGWVRRWDEGNYRILFEGSTALRVVLRGRRMFGVGELNRTGARGWTFAFRRALHDLSEQN